MGDGGGGGKKEKLLGGDFQDSLRVRKSPVLNRKHTMLQ
jgi:hypothetical protein